MEEENKELNRITLETNEVKLTNEEIITDEVYDQDIGEEYRIDFDEVNYEESANIDDVLSNTEVIPKVTEDDKTEPDQVEPENQEELVEEIVEEPENKVESENKAEPEVNNNVVNKKESTLKSDQKIIKITGIIAIILVIIVAILFLTRKKVEKGKPVIKLVGEETIVLELDSEYKDPGYFALDQEDGDITSRVNVIGEVNTTIPGVYRIKYKVLDTDRLKTEIYRNVIVKSKTSNFDFSLKGNDIVFINPNGDYIEEGYEAKYDGQNIGSSVQVFGQVDRTNPGNYNIYYALSKDDQVAVLKRTVVVFKGEEMSSDADLITELNNWLIDELHYSNKISLDNVSSSVLLYFGALNCRNDKSEISSKELNECLAKILNTGKITVPLTTKYHGKSADIEFDNNKAVWVISKLELPRLKDDLFKIVVNNDLIYLYELYGYEVLLNNREICDGNDNKIYYSGVDRNTLLGYASCKLAPCNGENCETNIIKNENYKLALYIHTFRVSNGKYYWTSTEMVK